MLGLSPELRAQTTIKYDLAFRHWGQFYAPWQDWHWWKAQGMAESDLNPSARSRCGAIGIMQLMAATAAGLKVDPYDVEGNIQGGIKYDASLLRMWARAADAGEQRDLAFASYNAGGGNVGKAVVMAGAPPRWSAARVFLPRVTGAHSGETVNYVARIRGFYGQIR